MSTRANNNDQSGKRKERNERRDSNQGRDRGNARIDSQKLEKKVFGQAEGKHRGKEKQDTNPEGHRQHSGNHKKGKYESDNKKNLKQHQESIADPQLLKFCEKLKSKTSIDIALIISAKADIDRWRDAFLVASQSNLLKSYLLVLLKCYSNMTDMDSNVPSAYYVCKIIIRVLKECNLTGDDIILLLKVVDDRLCRSASLNTISFDQKKDIIDNIIPDLYQAALSTKKQHNHRNSFMSSIAKYASQVEGHDPIENIHLADDISWYNKPSINWLLTECSKAPENTMQSSYESIDSYAETMISLWSYLTFYCGVGALWPKCYHGGDSHGRRNQSPTDQCCNTPMLCYVSASTKRCSMKIRSPGGICICANPAQWSCYRRDHDAICDDCLSTKQTQLIGAPGKNASTDIYDAEIFSVSVAEVSESTTIVLNHVESRKPPTQAISWRTTYRLQSAGLVAIVSVPAEGSPLQKESILHFGEIVPHDSKDPRRESKRRAEKFLNIRLLCRADATVLSANNDKSWRKGKRVAVIDMRVFVPEVMSVLGTLSDPSFKRGLSTVPFQTALLGKPEPLPVFNCGWVQREQLLLCAVEKSGIAAIKSLPREYKERYVEKLCASNIIKSLDQTQLMAFTYGLACNVHVTQGPPGTGKSYVGVCLVLALVILREMMQETTGRSLGPILSLSYKNHALDEFLLDCLKNHSNLSQQHDALIRLGKPENEELMNFTEKRSKWESSAQKTLLACIKVVKLARQQLNIWKDSLCLGEIPKNQLILRVMNILVNANLDEQDEHTAFELLKQIDQFGSLKKTAVKLLQECEHWKDVQGDDHKLLQKWMDGESPPPRCEFQIETEKRCTEYCRDGSKFCKSHVCANPNCVEKQISKKHPFCQRHICARGGCVNEVVPSGKFCVLHACKICIKELSVPGGTSCKKHKCKVENCTSCSLLPFSFCLEHACTVCRETNALSDESLVDVSVSNSNVCRNHMCEENNCTAMKHLPLKSNFCERHGCIVCGKHVDAKVPEAQLCNEHRCKYSNEEESEYCSSRRIVVGGKASDFCEQHTCVGCVHFRMPLTLSTFAPRFTCDQHLLCDFTSDDNGVVCNRLRINDSSFCGCHQIDSAPNTCMGFVKKSKSRCKVIKPSSFVGPWFCDNHSKQKKNMKLPEKVVSLDVAPSLGEYMQMATAAPVQIHERKDKEPQLLSCGECDFIGTCATVKFIDSKFRCPFHFILCSKPQEESVPIELGRVSPSAEAPQAVQIPTTAISRGVLKERAVPARRVVEFVDDDHPEVDEEALNRNTDEQELVSFDDYDDDDDVHAHNRQIYQEEEDIDEEDDDNSHSSDSNLAESANNQETLDIDIDQMVTQEEALQCVQSWSWKMSVDERHESVHHVVQGGILVLSKLLDTAQGKVEKAREQKMIAASQLLKQATLIGGTVVGAAKRLGALRAAEPFAIIVEEACEVMEPTLIAVLAVESVQKLELVGDHKQLPAFVQNCWFHVEKSIPMVKKSLFERLIDSGKNSQQSNLLMHTVLDVQRRMRKNIADLTRPEYSQIVEIVDHPCTATQRIGDKLQASISYRKPPGLAASVFFWDMEDNVQSRPKVGLSACNENEAKAVVDLVQYLCKCGVPAASITVITPYQGQRRVIVDSLIAAGVLPRRRDPNSPTSTVIVSTVDSYQGDENDIVILSLVRPNPGNLFVSFANRFIVAASRARLGFYIVGSKNAVSSVRHWSAFLEHLETEDAEADDDVTCRVGNYLPLCCPCHPDSDLHEVPSDPKRRQIPLTSNDWFCDEICQSILPRCGHKCTKRCHALERETHDEYCTEVLPRRCVDHHSIPLECGSISIARNETWEYAYQNYKCAIESEYQRRDCMHTINLTCHLFHDYEAGKRPWPECNEIMTDDFRHPICSHKISRLPCHQFRTYLANPPICMEKTFFTFPRCGHKLSIVCSSRGKYENGEIPCKRIVDSPRPRCGHLFQNECHLLDSWRKKFEDASFLCLPSNGARQCIDEGSEYGPAEAQIVGCYPCKEKIDFRRKCGHVRKGLECSKAFEAVLNTTTKLGRCEEQARNEVCPLCEAKINIKCCFSFVLTSIRNLLNASFPAGLNSSVIPIRQEQLESFRRDVLRSNERKAMWTVLKRSHCQGQINISQTCGHSQPMPCQTLISFILSEDFPMPPCSTLVKKRQPICAHEVEVPCWEDSLPGCKETISAEYRDSRCGCRMPVNVCGELTALRANPELRECTNLVSTFHKRCQHSISLRCSQRRLVEVAKTDGVVLPSDNTTTIPVKQGERYCVPCDGAPACRALIPFQRGCGHIIPSVSCHDAFRWAQTGTGIVPAKCDDMVAVAEHPICRLHAAQWPCWVTLATREWQPWATGGVAYRVPRWIEEGNAYDFQDLAQRMSTFQRYLPATVSFQDVMCRQPLRARLPCGHTCERPCHEFFMDASKGDVRCQEEQWFTCSNCQKPRIIHCWERSRKTDEQLVSECTTTVAKTCHLCHTNTVDVACNVPSVSCGRVVETQLPCGHVTRWTCSPEKGNLAATHDNVCQFNPKCVECCIVAWENIAKVPFTLTDIQTFVKRRLDETARTSKHSFVIDEERPLLLTSESLGTFKSGILTQVRKVVSAMRSQQTPIPPPIQTEEDRLRCLCIYDAVENAPTNIATAAASLSANAVEEEEDDEDDDEEEAEAEEEEEAKEATDVCPVNSEELFDWFKIFFDVLFLDNKPGTDASPDNLRQRFASKATEYGHSLRLKSLAADYLVDVLLLNQAQNPDHYRAQMWVACVFRGLVAVDVPPFDDPRHDAECNKLRKRWESTQGCAGIVLSRERPITADAAVRDTTITRQEEDKLWQVLQEKHDHVVWSRDTVLPMTIVTVSLEAECVLGCCMSAGPRFPKSHVYGWWCTQQHFLCWECVELYATQATSPTTETKPIGEGYLPCPCKGSDCSHFQLQSLSAMQAPKDAFDAVNQYETTIRTRQAALEAQEAERERGELELKRMLALDEQQRRVNVLVREIREEILCQRCPACKKVWEGFDGCFVVYCNCTASFCGWCLQRFLHEDGHRHVVHCPENPRRGNVYGDLAQMKEVRNRQRIRQIQTKMQTIPEPDIRSKVLQTLGKDFRDLNLRYPQR